MSLGQLDGIPSLALRVSAANRDGGAVGDGFLGAHPLGIWDLANPADLLATTTIPAGTSANLLDGFRYVEVPSLIPPSGHHYAIAALYRTEDFVVGTVNNPSSLVFTPGPGIELGDYRFAGSVSDLVFPDGFEPGPVSGFGPNFTYSLLSPVPEPSLYGVMGAVSLGGIVLVRRFKNRKTQVART